MRESLRHGVTAHNWFAHYLWDIYKGFGHNGKIIQRTLPSHTQPSRSDLAACTSEVQNSSYVNFFGQTFQGATWVYSKKFMSKLFSIIGKL